MKSMHHSRQTAPSLTAARCARLALAALALATAVPVGAHGESAPAGAKDAEHRPPPVAGDRALPPAAGAIVEGAFARMAPAFKLKNASLQGDRVDAEICADVAARRGCHRLVLGDPEAPCAGEVVGPWCLTWPAGPPAEALLGVARAALASDDPSKVWTKVATEPPPEQQEADADPPIARALLMLLGALLAGALAGLAGRRAGRWRWLAWLVLAALPWLALWPPASEVPGRGAWDWLIMALLWDLALADVVLWTWLKGGWRLALAGCVALVGLVALAEVALAPEQSEDAGGAVAMHWQAEGTDRRACELVFEGVAGDDDPFATAHDQPQPVVHFGSGLLYGEGWAARDELRRNLEQHGAGSRHVIAGLGRGAGDFQLLALQTLLRRQPVRAVVLHLAAEKDVAEMDAPVACCGAGPLLSYAEPPEVAEASTTATQTVQGAAAVTATDLAAASTATIRPALIASARCERPRWQQSLRLYLAGSPPPEALLALAHRSHIAARAVAAVNRLSRRLRPRTATWGHTPETTWRHFEAAMIGIRDALKQARIPLLVVLLPYPDALAADQPKQTPWHRRHRRMAELLARLDIPTVDAWQHFDATLAKGPAQGVLRGDAKAGWELTGPGRSGLVRWLGAALATRLPRP